MTGLPGQDTLAEILESIDLPESAYLKAKARYKDLGTWFARSESSCAPFSPHVYSQGSFRLGTVVRPLDASGEYDLDVGCRLGTGISTASHTQRQLKHLVGDEVAAYRVARKIESPRQEKRRCWRLAYQDDIKFHLDAVPSIPASIARRTGLREAMRAGGLDASLASTVADLSGSITDTNHPAYTTVSLDWYVSNSEGFARWFESRMRLASQLLQERAVKAGRAKIDELPSAEWKTPLQAAIQLLKRHRDVMYRKNIASAPISIIITTLAAQGYQGERDVASAVRAILGRMGSFVRAQVPRVPNPVNPAEDFADKWAMLSLAPLKLEQNFWAWLKQAQADFEAIVGGTDRTRSIESAQTRFDVSLGANRGPGSGPGGLLRPAVALPPLSFPPKPVTPNKPAGFA